MTGIDTVSNNRQPSHSFSGIPPNQRDSVPGCRLPSGGPNFRITKNGDPNCKEEDYPTGGLKLKKKILPKDIKITPFSPKKLQKPKI